MIHKYSLADYQLTIGIPQSVAQKLNLKDAEGNLLTSFTIGGPGENGEGSFVGQIVASRGNNLWETEGDATGSWVHNKNLNKTGTIELQIRQISDQVIELAQLCDIYESVQENVEGLTLTVNSSATEETTPMVTGVDSYIQKQADLTLAETAGMLTWVFTCGQVMFYQ